MKNREIYKTHSKNIGVINKTFVAVILLLLIIFNVGCENKADFSESLTVETDIFPKNDNAVAEHISEDVLPAVEVSRVSFLAAGDNVIHKSIYLNAQKRAAQQKANGTPNVAEYDFKPMYAGVTDYISSFDLAFINQETLMAGEEYGYSSYPTFNSPREAAYDLMDVGFDIVNLANNHMCDKGKAALDLTIDFWKSLDVTMIGGYSDREDYDTPRVVECNGINIALIGYTEMTNGMHDYSDTPVIPYTNDEDIINQLAVAKENADVVIVSVHWGNENQNTPTKEQQRLAQLFCDNGADVIIGHHPHVLQPIEELVSTDGEHTALCAYSLGNFVSAMASWQNMVGGFLTFDIVKMSDGSCFIDSSKFIPTVFFYGAGYFDTYIYFLDEYTDTLALKHGTKSNYGSYASLETINEYVNKIIGEYVSNDCERRNMICN